MNSESYKVFFSASSIILTFIAFAPYVLSIYQRKTKPHVFSWVIWSLTTLIVFFAQLEAKGGLGAWPTGVSGVITLWIASLAFLKSGDTSVSRTDWAFFLCALVSLPIWFFTSDPLSAVIVLTTVDLLGFGPTLQRAYHFPHEENILFFSLFIFRNILSIFALERFSWTTILFPLLVAMGCVVLVAVVWWRRFQMDSDQVLEK